MKIHFLLVTAVLSVASALAATPPSTEPIARWSFDQVEKNDFTSTGLSGRPAQIIGTVKSVAGVADSAASFGGEPVGQLIIPLDLLTATKGVFTFEFWLRVTGKVNSYGTCLDAGGQKGFVIRTNNSNRLTVSTDGKWNVIATTVPLAEKTWTHVAFTADGATVRLFVNGKDAGVLAIENPLRLASFLQLGSVTERVKRPDDSVIEAPVKPLIGDLDELKLYDRILSPSEIAADAKAP